MEDKQIAAPDLNSEAPEEKGALRRRKLLALSSSALIATSVSRPVWATGAACSPSALASVSASGVQEYQGCSKSAGFWKTEASNRQAEAWPMPATTPFNAVFTTPIVPAGATTPLYQGMTIGQVIAFGGNNPDPAPGNFAFGFHLIGALCNAFAFPASPAGGFSMTVDQVKALFNGLQGGDENDFQTVKGILEAANNEFDGDYSWL
ncbi:hypothetical protein R0135_07630 [Congregibacter variabilis]|uniref:Uncharacterized protein n=1 Tax=Congregibacter variabilis TaxID=3081200 RepID=A0ABZ0I777_9GAMM|nr:hypothetical protein R0135_07630 [Congregibacter sp. IMCC43200]